MWIVKLTLAALRSRWMRFFIGFDPATALERAVWPVLGALAGQLAEYAGWIAGR